MGSAPPVVAVGFLADPNRGLKDSARNILDMEEFVVNLVPYHLADAMNITAIDAPAGLDELALAGLDTSPSQKIKTPRIMQSPVVLECTLMRELTTGPN